LEWANSLSTGTDAKYAALKIALINEIRDEEIDGDTLLDICDTPSSLIGQLRSSLPNIKTTTAKKVTRNLESIKEAGRANPGNLFANAANANNSAVNNNANNANNSGGGGGGGDGGTFTVFVSGLRAQKLVKIHGMRASHTVATLKNFIKDEGSVAVSNFGLNAHGKELTDTATLAHCQIAHETVVHYFALTNGGTTRPSSTAMVPNRRHINWRAYPNIRKTRKGDCLFAYKMSKGYSVAEMPCGHAMESDSMFRYMDSIISTGVAKIEIHCPVPKCKQLWDYQLCCRVAGMSDLEHAEYIRKKEIRDRDDISECPHCHTTQQRKPGNAILKMTCSSCKTSGDWCWVCGKLWKSGNLMFCGNADCKYIAGLNDALATCIAEVPYGWANLSMPVSQKMIPKIRACPQCLQFIKKPYGCKHTKCRGCKHEFCFACLRTQAVCSADNGASYTVFCFVAARQKFS
jgi:hypothetical protein